MNIISNNYLPGDQRLIEQIVRELKSQGIFDQFRKECISDVDTKPAYQNLRQRVESSVSGFLTKQTWNPEMNKNQVREMLRKNIHESGFLETGVERIVDQVVNPKITTVFLTKVEDVVYKFLGIEKPIKVDSSATTPIKVNSFHDLLPTDLEAVSPEMPEDKDMEIKDNEDVKMEEESPTYELLNEKKDKLSQEENSIDSSQSSIVSGINSNDSNHSQKQDSLMSLNSSESRLSLVISENTSKMEGDDVFISHKLSLPSSKLDFQNNEKMDIETVNQDPNKELEDVNNSFDQISNQSDAVVQKSSEDINSKLKDSVNKKRERQHSSSEKSRSKSDRDRTKSDKHKKDEKDHCKEQPIEKEKYKIPRLSDKNKSDKLGKSKEKDKHDKDGDKRSDKDKRSAKHSSERDRSKSDSRSKKDGKSDRRDKEKDDKKEKKDSSKNEKFKEERKSSSYSSKQKEKSSYKEKDKETKKMNDEGKNGHSSSTSSSTKKDSSSSKHKKDEDKSRSSKRKDEKNDKDDKKKKKSSKDDHYSSKEKKNGRRSSDRDSDGPSENKILPVTPLKNSEKYSQAPTQESFHSNSENSTDDSGNKDKVEDINEQRNDTLHLEMQKFKLPKYASNLQEAMKIMKIRKQLKKFENTNKLNSENTEVKQLLKDIAEISKDGRKDKEEETEYNQQILEIEKIEANNDSIQSLALNINDFISSSNISIDKWNALEAKYMGEMSYTDYDSYESPYVDDELEAISSETNMNSGPTEEMVQNVENNMLENVNGSRHEISHVNNQQLEKINSTRENEEMNNEFEGTIYDSMGVLKSEIQFEQTNDKNKRSLSIEDDNKLCSFTQTAVESKNYEELNSLAIQSRKLDSNSSSQLGEIQPHIECQTNKLISSKLTQAEKDKETNSKKKIKFEECQRKAIVRLEKNSLAEEMIQNKQIGKHVILDNTSDNLNKDNTLKSLETEKENIQVNNKIIIVQKSNFTETHSSLESAVRPMKRFENNHEDDEDATNTKKTLLDDRICSNSDEIFPRICEQDHTDSRTEGNYIFKSVNEKIFDRSYQNYYSEKSLPDVNIKEDHEEDPCLGFESSDIERKLTILKCLIKSFEDNICESNKKIKQLKFDKQQNISLYPEKVETKDQSDISNNNLHSKGYKRKKLTSDSNSLISKKLRTKDFDTEESTDIALESKFSLPLSPAESEHEKRVDTRVNSKKNRKIDKNVISTIGNIEECNTTSTGTKFKSPPKRSRGKKSTGQRYSSEDLYKPRIFLRRSRSGPNDS